MPESPEVLSISLGHVHAYLLKKRGIGVLIDTGLPGSAPSILRRLRSGGLDIGDLRLIVLTHAHYDHAGAAADLRAACGAQILASRLELQHLGEGRTPFPRGLNPYARLASKTGRRLMGSRRQFKPLVPDISIDSPFDLVAYGLEGQAVPLPGHSAGSLCVILDSGEAFVGDAAFNIFPRSVVPPLADDPAALLESWRLLLASGARTFYPGHGKPFGREKLQSSLLRLERLTARMNQ
jgi:glyoxylase-like metal-dependent hydrolase (beta-lactamase superfamily II)